MVGLVKGVFDLLRDRSVATVVKATTATRCAPAVDHNRSKLIAKQPH